MCNRLTTSLPSVIMIANEVGDNHQSVEFICSCADNRQLMIALAMEIKESLFIIQASLQEQKSLIETNSPHPIKD